MGGNLLAKPITDKHSDKGGDSRLFYVASGMQGWRTTMEDAHATVLELDSTKKGHSFFGVYDGHGGSKVARYSGEKLHIKIANEEAFKKGDHELAIKNGYLGIDEDLKRNPDFNDDPSGCTAVISLITPDDKVFVGNAGDSRAVLCHKGELVVMSEDHKPNIKTETDRITKAGGFVELNRVNGNLALSRAIGDFEFKQNENLDAEEQIVTVLPEVREFQLSEETEFLVLACDGIWDCLTSEEVVGFIRKRVAHYKMDFKDTCESLMDYCLARDREAGGMGYDNMTVIIVGFLHGKTEEQWYEWIRERVKNGIGLTFDGKPAEEKNEEDTSDEPKGRPITLNPNPNHTPPVPNNTPEPSNWLLMTPPAQNILAPPSSGKLEEAIEDTPVPSKAENDQIETLEADIQTPPKDNAELNATAPSIEQSDTNADIQAPPEDNAELNATAPSIEQSDTNADIQAPPKDNAELNATVQSIEQSDTNADIQALPKDNPELNATVPSIVEQSDTNADIQAPSKDNAELNATVPPSSIEQQQNDTNADIQAPPEDNAELKATVQSIEQSDTNADIQAPPKDNAELNATVPLPSIEQQQNDTNTDIQAPPEDNAESNGHNTRVSTNIIVNT